MQRNLAKVKTFANTTSPCVSNGLAFAKDMTERHGIVFERR
jgi:hypothetical protein